MLRGKISRETSCDALVMVLAIVLYFGISHTISLCLLLNFTHTRIHTEDITFIIIFINIIPNIIVSIIIQSTLIVTILTFAISDQARDRGCFRVSARRSGGQCLEPRAIGVAVSGLYSLAGRSILLSSPDCLRI